MLYILFSPSEGKRPGGTNHHRKDILFGTEPRSAILSAYNTLVNSGDGGAVSTLFGIKKESEITPYIEDLFDAPQMSAIERYNGVAFGYLNYQTLDAAAQAYLEKQVIIFSNLFGPILGGDLIANYKVKQGNSIGEIAPDKFYKERFSYQLDLQLMNHEILDLRAGYYDKFYKSRQNYTALKFLKEGKTVSHWAKAYRGIVLRELASHQIESIDDFMKLEIETLKVEEIIEVKNRKEIVYSILE
jgi:cytoplasmic iron level regulating protein YaaA (DUF328/UPF0246 family)